jgi:hypothetical protein
MIKIADYYRLKFRTLHMILQIAADKIANSLAVPTLARLITSSFKRFRAVFVMGGLSKVDST